MATKYYHKADETTGGAVPTGGLPISFDNPVDTVYIEVTGGADVFVEFYAEALAGTPPALPVVRSAGPAREFRVPKLKSMVVATAAGTSDIAYHGYDSGRKIR